MPQPNLTAFIVGHEYTSVPLDEIASRVKQGEVIVLPKCMQAIAYFEQLKAASLEGIRQAVGENKAQQVRQAGFEAVHTIIELDELTSIVHSNYHIFRSLAPELSKKVVKAVFQTDKPFYYESEPNVRFHIPFDDAVKKKEELCQFLWNGKITAHCPHHDSWYDCPSNSINIWIAVGAVKIGNGLSIYPQVYGKRLPCTEDGRILRNQYFGRALNFELEPGDAIIFHGEHLHSSEINSTDETRHVVSLRITLEKPQLEDKSASEFIYSGFGGEFMALLARLQTKVSTRIAKLTKWGEKEQTGSKSVFDDTSTDFPQPLPVEQGEMSDPTNLCFDESKLKVGEIRPLSPKLCAARLNKDRVVVFSRNCPHEGADLAAGYVVDECVVCPWHNLPFSMNTGASPCKSLPGLNVCEYSDNQKNEELQTTTIC